MAPKDRNIKDQVLKLRIVFFDFDGVFTDNSVYVFEDGREAVRCTRGDGYGLRRLERLGIEPMILSSEVNPVVAKRSEKLAISCHHGLTDKRDTMNRLLQERGLTSVEAAFVGNDINDADCLGAVGFPVVVQDAHPDVVGLALYQTRLAGGHGAVREVCDLIASLFEANGGGAP